MNPFTEELAGVAEQEQRRSDHRNYLAGLDFVFGLTKDVIDPKKIEEIKERANVGGERQLGMNEGVDVYVSRELIEAVERRLGWEKTRQYLGVYKDEVQDKFMGIKHVDSPSMEQDRKEAKEGLFMTSNVRRITF